MANNYWGFGGEDAAALIREKKIIDHFDEEIRPVVDFSPWLDESPRVPELIPSELTIPDGLFFAGGTMDVTYRVHNTSDQADTGVSTAVLFYLNTSASLHNAVLLATVAVERLNADTETDMRTIRLQLPPASHEFWSRGLPARYSLNMLVDPFNQVPEHLETNNTLTRSIEVTTGDTNGDNQVNIADLNNVRNNFGGQGLGDTDGDGDVDISDLNAVRNNFGAGEPSPALLGRGDVRDGGRDARAGVLAEVAVARSGKNIEDVLFSSQLDAVSSAQSSKAGLQARRLKTVDRWFAML